MAARLDIALQRNEDWARSIVLTDDDGAPIDLTGCTLAMQVREKLSQALIASAEIEIVDAVGGFVGITLLASEGTPLGRYGASIQVANLHYDLRMIDSGGSKVPLLAGIIILSRGETRQ
jgi:hypothetical protein